MILKIIFSLVIVGACIGFIYMLYLMHHHQKFLDAVTYGDYIENHKNIKSRGKSW
jgi:Na+/proline symporter